MFGMYGHRGLDPYGVVPGTGAPVFPGGAYGSLGDAMERPRSTMSLTAAGALAAKIRDALSTAESALSRGLRTKASQFYDVAANAVGRLDDATMSQFADPFRERLESLRLLLQGPVGGGIAGGRGGSLDVKPRGSGGNSGGRAPVPEANKGKPVDIDGDLEILPTEAKGSGWVKWLVGGLAVLGVGVAVARSRKGR